MENLPLHGMAIGRRERSADPQVRRCGSSLLGKLVHRSWQDNDGNKRQGVEIQVQHLGPDLQFATATAEKATAEKGTAEKQSA